MRIENIKENTTYYLIVESSMFRHYPVCFIQEIKFEMWDLPLNESLIKEIEELQENKTLDV